MKTKTKNKGGRPFLSDPKDKKNKYITCKVSEREKEDFTKTAAFNNCKTSEYLRNLIYKELGISVKKKPNEDQRENRTELRKIGVNLNQLTKASNQNQLSQMDILRLQKCLILLERKLEEL